MIWQRLLQSDQHGDNGNIINGHCHFIIACLTARVAVEHGALLVAVAIAALGVLVVRALQEVLHQFVFRGQ